MNERSERRFPSGFAREGRPFGQRASWKLALQERRILSGFVCERRSFVYRAAWKAALHLAVLLVFCAPAHGYSGSGESSLFTVDTRWNYSDGSASGLFRIDTRLSGSAGDAASGTFTVDTTGASVGTAVVAGYIRDANGAFLPDATVSALQSSVVRAQAFTDASGYFQLTALPPGTYQLRAEKSAYLTDIRNGVSVSAGATVLRDFALTGKPPVPVTTPVSRPPETSARFVPSGEQLKVFSHSQGVFVANGTIDRTKLTVVFSHGWNSHPDVWAKSMASNLVAGGVRSANLLAWDWQKAAGTGPLLSLALSATPGEGETLGLTLAAKLGSDYRQPIHFIGHSLGTLINAKAADNLHRLHEQGGGAFDWRSTQMTLLDDAGVANVEGTLVQLGYNLVGVEAPYSVGNIFTCGWVSPIPQRSAWMDNYISLVGFYHAEAVNVFLAKAPDYADKRDPVAFVKSVHGYACQWYGYTARAPEQSLLGNRYSFERLGADAEFTNPTLIPLGSLLSQDFGSTGELALTPLRAEEEIKAAQARQSLALGVFGLQSSVNFAAGVAQTVGSVIVDVGQSFIPHTPTGTPVFTGTAGSTPAYYTDSRVEEMPAWSLQVSLRSGAATQFSSSSRLESDAPVRGAPVSNRLLADGVSKQSSTLPKEDRTTETAVEGAPGVWFPVAIPANAAVFSFDFTFTGEPGEDVFSASIGGTNAFALEAKFMPANATLNSGPIIVSSWAGQTVECFFGLLGGTSSNADVTVSGMRFYQVERPMLAAEFVGNELLVSWPATMTGYVLESAESLGGVNPWSEVASAPALVGLRNVVATPVSGPAKFYRLRKP